MRLPMFPLGSVVFPFTAVPLRIFETRYQHLLDDVVAGDHRFGSVLIEKGSEVGGGDERFDVGAIVKVSNVSRLPEGDHRLVVVAGTERLRVVRWLAEEPYPQAEVEVWPDAAEEVPEGLIEDIRGRVRKVLALASELGADTSAITAELADEPVAASYQASALTPVTPLDSHRLLAAPGPASRMQVCREMLDESSRLLTLQLGEI